MAQPFSPGSLTSQQSLFETIGEDSSLSQIKANLRDGYFPLTTPSSADKTLDITTRGDNHKPLLLLVEDNEINLRVC
jgi:hypothetical protein